LKRSAAYGTDAQSYSFVDNKPIMLTQKGQVNENGIG
jgi:hypothetical protein